MQHKSQKITPPFGTDPSSVDGLMCPAFRGLELLESHATWMVRFIFSYSFGVSIPRAL